MIVVSRCRRKGFEAEALDIDHRRATLRVKDLDVSLHDFPDTCCTCRNELDTVICNLRRVRRSESQHWIQGNTINAGGDEKRSQTSVAWSSVGTNEALESNIK